MLRLPEGEHALPEVTFFLDRNLGAVVVPRELRALGLSIEVHADHFPASETDDRAWILEVARKGWVILSKDASMASRSGRNRLELEALLSTDAAAFIFSRAEMTALDCVELFCEKAKYVSRLLGSQPRPFIAFINRGGVVRLEPATMKRVPVRLK